MQAISLWLAAAIVILTGWAIVKKYQVNMVLFPVFNTRTARRGH